MANSTPPRSLDSLWSGAPGLETLAFPDYEISAPDVNAMDALRRIIENHIAALEILQAMERALANGHNPPPGVPTDKSSFVGLNTKP